jgi:hypothetical protein
MGKKSRDKGNRVEREMVLLHKALGVACARVPLSGAAGGLFDSDLRISVAGFAWKAECKARGDGSGFKQLERWLGDNDVLLLRRDRAEPLVVLPWRTYAALLRAAAKGTQAASATTEATASQDAPQAILDAFPGTRGEG